MIPVIGTRLWVVEVGVVPSVVFGDGTTAGFISVTTLVGERAIPALVSV
jgi:hypothetical protein